MSDADERARLRARLEADKVNFPQQWERCTHELRGWQLQCLLDDVEKAERERDQAVSGDIDVFVAQMCARDPAFAEQMQTARDVGALRARAERLEEALFAIANTPMGHKAIARAALAEPAPGGQDAERAVNAEGPPGSYGCKCTSRNALECARQAYYAGVEARERCGCLCHQWTDSGP